MVSTQLTRAADSMNTAVKGQCRVATTANITLEGEQTIDGVAVVAGDRVLCKNQSLQYQNGVWVCSSGAWERANDFNSSTDGISGFLVQVGGEGAVNKNRIFQVVWTGNLSLGTTNLSVWYHSMGHASGTFADGDTTPSVAGGTWFAVTNTSPTTITYLDDGILGQEVFLICTNANTTFDVSGTFLKGNGGVDFTPTAYSHLVRCTFDNNWWWLAPIPAS